MAAYIGPEITLRDLMLEPAYGLMEQSWGPREMKEGRLNADGYGFGLGIGTLGPDGPAWLSQVSAGQPQAYGHNGTIFGYTSAMLIEPATSNIVVVLTNTDRLVADSAVALVSKAAGCDQSDRP